MSRGFEIETELTVHALELRMPCAEELTAYGERPSGSVSKLSTFRDGAKFCASSSISPRNERPLQFFGLVGASHPSLPRSRSLFRLPETSSETGLVPRLPTGVLVAGLTIVGFLSRFAGLDFRCRGDDAQRDRAGWPFCPTQRSR